MIYVISAAGIPVDKNIYFIVPSSLSGICYLPEDMVSKWCVFSWEWQISTIVRYGQSWTNGPLPSQSSVGSSLNPIGWRPCFVCISCMLTAEPNNSACGSPPTFWMGLLAFLRALAGVSVWNAKCFLGWICGQQEFSNQGFMQHPVNGPSGR